ncbi:cyclic AMP-responsive element-binding protein 3-like protein 4 [Eurytemora carolleeae]|uniref:cyclic AMP-responsive element-binding protein 3-like protein 4 n=1 Tax=Eurytemora carolleeae TaxID=1294199 RepID=UPI000C790A77|nr:cyclic AMP-responsive element-binding protein 3-like protein 4 [Eurytemora carolleeae]|eukprot:XP_023320114.1 cyclic AMP-responsive element-binding protein 3-like protein 4 [Eurytemora affinis]
MASKEGMSFPKYYPLTREEERNLKKIRRKIRNKLSAQDSRKRKREYLDNMEDRVKICSDENQELKDKIKALETQNKTLAAQLRRLHQIVVNGGMRQGQTSTALMVLLLSTALFLIPGVRDQNEGKAEIDIQAAVKMPPMPGQSRSLLQFPDPMDRNNDIADLADFEEEVKSEPGMDGGKEMNSRMHTDHDYTALYPGMKTEPGRAWIDEDAPPLGYGSALKLEEDEDDDEVVVDRHMNVNVSSSGQGTRTVVLQIPKDIK